MKTHQPLIPAGHEFGSAATSHQPSLEADRMLADLHTVLRCRCCPSGGLFDAFSHLWETPSQDASPRALQRSDFIALIGANDLDRNIHRTA
jgi:hypothetical protein